MEIELDSSAYKRSNSSRVDEAIAKLHVYPSADFLEFYKAYEGPFSSEKTGFELLDICEPSDNSIVSSTIMCRDQYELPRQFLVVSNYLGNSVLVYDTESDKIYNMDFEGGDELVKLNKLEPQFRSFGSFLGWYFQGKR